MKQQSHPSQFKHIVRLSPIDLASPAMRRRFILHAIPLHSSHCKAPYQLSRHVKAEPVNLKNGDHEKQQTHRGSNRRLPQGAQGCLAMRGLCRNAASAACLIDRWRAKHAGQGRSLKGTDQRSYWPKYSPYEASQLCVSLQSISSRRAALTNPPLASCCQNAGGMLTD